MPFRTVLRSTDPRHSLSRSCCSRAGEWVLINRKQQAMTLSFTLAGNTTSLGLFTKVDLTMFWIDTNMTFGPLPTPWKPAHAKRYQHRH